MKTELFTPLKRQAIRILADLHSSTETVLITEHDHMNGRMTILEGIARGEQAIQNRLTSTNDDARRQFAKWL